MKLILSAIIGLIISLALGPIIIPMLKKLHAGQSIREDGPKSHLSKSGTPTIGGLIFLISMAASNLLVNNLSFNVLMVITAGLGFAAIGFMDDYIKVVKKRNLGLRAYQKLLCQIFIAVVLIVYKTKIDSLSFSVYVPIVKRFLNLGLLYIPFIIFVVVGTVNSVNLTDGLDGLSSGVTIICLGFFTLAAIKLGFRDLSIFCMSLMGALLGFLVFNRYPAKVFMGDTGSLALGGIISALAVILNLPLALPIAGGIYFVETLSVIIQVISFKTRGKRVFLMSPLHHHFEQKGWRERRVVLTFYVAELVLCIIAYWICF